MADIFDDEMGISQKGCGAAWDDELIAFGGDVAKADLGVIGDRGLKVFYERCG